MKLHKEGYTPIALAILFIFVLNALIQFYHPTAHTLKWTIYILSAAFFLVMLLFFRSPFVDIATDETAVLSPADGKIISISEVDEAEFLKDKRMQLSLTMSPIKVHVSRNPIGGVVSYFKYHKGQPKSATDYERTTICVQNSEGVSVLLRQIAGAFARRIVWYVKEGDIVDQGQQFGFVKFGSRIDILVPLGSNILVTVGDVVKGGQTILAELPSDLTDIIAVPAAKVMPVNDPEPTVIINEGHQQELPLVIDRTEPKEPVEPVKKAAPAKRAPAKSKGKKE